MHAQDYIPWNAVATNWANRRTVWARRLRECPDTSGVIKHLLQLEPPRLAATKGGGTRVLQLELSLSAAG